MNLNPLKGIYLLTFITFTGFDLKPQKNFNNTWDFLIS